MLSKKQAARMIDISAVRTSHTLKDVEAVVEIAKRYSFINVHTLPCWTRELARMLADEPDIYTGAPVGFPGGGHRTEVKLAEARMLVEDGVDEMDIVMNVGKFKSGDYRYVSRELDELLAVVPAHVKTKVIIEMNALDDRELETACQIVIGSGADFLKTGTGWLAGNANVERIARVMALCEGKVKVKAAGGIRTREDFEALVALGVHRLGINTQSALQIVESYPE